MSCFVYFIEAKNGERRSPVKVGVANDIGKRIKELQCGNHMRLSEMSRVRFDSRKSAHLFESKMHSYLRDNHLSGEWFNLTPKDVRIAITKMRKRGLFVDEIKNFVYG